MRIFLMIVAMVLSLGTQAQTINLIKDDEARLPAAELPRTRAITRGPAIRLVSQEQVARSGFPLKIVFEPRGGAQIDLASVRVEYLRNPVVDLTERIRPGLKAGGIDIPAATVPSGSHAIRVSLTDSEGRSGSAVLRLTAN